METKVEHLESLLAPYLSDDDEDSMSSFEVPGFESIKEDKDKQPLPQLRNESSDVDDLKQHKLLQTNSPKLTSLAIGEDSPYFPGCDMDDDEEEQWEAAGKYIAKHKYLTELSFGYFGGVTTWSSKGMCKGLAHNKSIRRLKLCSDSMWEHNHLTSLLPFLQQNGNLRELILMPEEYAKLKFGPKGILMVSVTLMKFNSLTSFEMINVGNGDELDDELMPHLFDALSCHTGLCSINLDGTLLGRNGMAALLKLKSKLNISDDNIIMGTNQGDSLAGRLPALGALGGLLNRSRADSDDTPPEPVIPTEVKPGIICRIDGLKSAGGMKLNGQRCVSIRYVEKEGRYETRIEHTDKADETFALKEANLLPLPKLVLPTHSHRGSLRKPKSLCELLLYYKGSGPFSDAVFSPSDITLRGYAASCLGQIDSCNLQWLVGCQLEQMAGVLGLASTCQESEEGAESVLFALLEGDPMYIDVLLQTITWTGLIDHESCDDEVFNGEFNNCPPTELTPDQESKPYIKFMSGGPLRLMVEMTRYKFGDALWAALKESGEFYHLFIQRMLRLVAREQMKTRDGIKLGPMARKILIQVLPGIRLKPNQPLKEEFAAKNLLLQTKKDSNCQFFTAENIISTKSLNRLFFGNSESY